MNDRLDALLGEIRFLEKELVREAQRKEIEFCYKIRDRTVQFTTAAKARQQKFRVSLHRYILDSRMLVFITAPFIWACLVPIVLIDLVGSLYQAICFPIYGIPRVHRRDYLIFDRHLLTYLNAIEKLNCEYCTYANGILAYFTEIAARTEQHWCPIKHAARMTTTHSRYKNFLDFGDADSYRQRIEEIRRAYGDLVAAPLQAKATLEKNVGQVPSE